MLLPLLMNLNLPQASNWQADYWKTQEIPSQEVIDQALADMGVIAQPDVTIETEKGYNYPKDDPKVYDVAYLKGVKERRKRHAITLLLLH